ncbi:geranylgeranylglycerol-phosphate geranylgeranyltransferase [Lacinutrix sp. 5H-3-7-4]|uniref:geranylgeranylglycerol-phosphate geranylgeranyltransferase n=1 Tax=Lacinutrix sp. (strain 5H-3-7-4) TaxID=983544 RepID=UPI0009FF5AB3|nr:geranylgeranylglycerol-phosphate geranylgeranyltransferase [Lacinutrix sp. 5H-3-7-4]
MKILNLIRYKNLIMIAVVQLLIKYALFPAFAVDITLNGIGFAVLVFATIFIAAGGYVINDIYDIETDAVNKPNKLIVGKTLSEDTANKLYILFTVIGVGLGYYLSNSVGRPPFFIVFLATSGLLYIYATYLKQIAVVGNIVVSAIVALSLLIVGIFELIPAINSGNQVVQSSMFEVLTDFAILAFSINFIREIVKDIQDVDGDHKSGMQTLPILFGKTRTAKIAFALTCLLILIIAYYIGTFVYMHVEAIIYFLILVIAPLIYIAIKLFMAENNKDFKHISLMLKLVMITGMFAMALYYFIL